VPAVPNLFWYSKDDRSIVATVPATTAVDPATGIFTILPSRGPRPITDAEALDLLADLRVQAERSHAGHLAHAARHSLLTALKRLPLKRQRALLIVAQTNPVWADDLHDALRQIAEARRYHVLRDGRHWQVHDTLTQAAASLHATKSTATRDAASLNRAERAQSHPDQAL
jgi:hypothetical protein